MDRHVVAKVADVPPGDRKLVTVKGRPIAVFNLKGEFFAIGDKCPHEAGALGAGRIVGPGESGVPGDYPLTGAGEILKFPWHGWEFDIRPGQVWCDPAGTRLRAFGAQIEPGAELNKGPYVAETFKVTVEDDYVVINL